MQYYTFTIRKCSNSKSISVLKRTLNFYESVIKYIKGVHEKVDCRYHYEYTIHEKDSYNVHLHAMIKYPNNAKVKLYFKGKQGFSIRYEKCDVKEAWDCYISKSPYTRQRIEELISALLHLDNGKAERPAVRHEDLSVPDRDVTNQILKKRILPKLGNQEDIREIEPQIDIEDTNRILTENDHWDIITTNDVSYELPYEDFSEIYKKFDYDFN